MAQYIVNRNAQPSSGDHEVHDLASTKGCLPDPLNRVDLGWHNSCREAVTHARNFYADVNGCASCASACHTT